MKPIFSENELIVCESCGDEITMIACEVYPWDYIESSIFEKGFAQGPWENGDLMECRECGWDWGQALREEALRRCREA